MYSINKRQVYFDRIFPFIPPQITDGLKQLMEKIHLYQAYTLELKDLSQIISSLHGNQNINEKDIRGYQAYYTLIPSYYWKIKNPLNITGGYLVPGSHYEQVTNSSLISIDAPSPLSLYCAKCGQIEPYNIVDVSCFVTNIESHEYGENTPTIQLFDFAYQCQSCRSTPEVFLIRRNDLTISIHGRSPIKRIDTPKYIPKNQSSYFSDAIYAYESNKIFAAFIYLRIFIEQFLREETGKTIYSNVEELYNLYKKKVDEKFKSRCTISLYSIYQDLSDCIHSAQESNEVFENAKDNTEFYFRELQLFNDLSAKGMIS